MCLTASLNPIRTISVNCDECKIISLTFVCCAVRIVRIRIPVMMYLCVCGVCVCVPIGLYLACTNKHWPKILITLSPTDKLTFKDQFKS